MLKVLRTIQTEIGSTNGTTVKAFRVRKRKAVLLALIFLKKHNSQYYDIVELLMKLCSKKEKAQTMGICLSMW